ncbi:MAG: UDP-N-acetylmuramate--L-alanine ligase [Synergistales bacterium 54_9]|nr:MAG: UDP-N-acetylmuramate--L-alanine ligase [Synergistales bacterium 54_9]
MGIGGAGMSGLALLLRQMGFDVSGCDVAHSCYIDKLNTAGIQFRIGHSREHIEEFHPDALVCSSAIPSGNAEILFAMKNGVPVFKRAEVLSWIFNRRIGIGISGTHGKTTTSSMVGCVFESVGLEPTVAIGGELCDIGGNAKLGRGQHMIAELDESDGSFELFKSHVAVVTNADWDHVDYYPSLHSVLSAYERFLDNRAKGGKAIVCGEDKGLTALLEKGIEGEVITYGWGSSWDWGAHEVVHKPGGGINFKVLHRGREIGPVTLQVSGDHNVLNALAACVVASCFFIPFEKTAEALQTFRGAKRRMQHMGKISNIDVFDDYGHHPKEVAATLTALRKMFPGRRLMTVFQPHRFTRTAAMYREFADVLTLADEIFLMPIYPADEMPIEGIDSNLIGDLMNQKGLRNFRLCSGSDEVVAQVCEFIKDGDVITTIGAGDVFTVGEKVIQQLQKTGLPTNAVALET